MPVVAVDLFCGIGGLTYGLKLAGIDVAAGIDVDESCKFAYEINNNAKFICKDINAVTSEQVRNFYPENSVKVLVGCAPCQPFSRYSIKYRKNGQVDEKWKLLYSFNKLIRECNPDIISMENVPSLQYEKVFTDFVKSLKKSNYYVSYKIVFCPDYGVPQNRSRLVLLASRFAKIELIDPIFNKNDYPTVRKAIGNLPHIRAGQTCNTDPLHKASSLSALNIKRIKQSIPGGSWKDWSSELKLSCHKKSTGKTYGSVYGRMEWDKPSPTITTQFYGYGNGRFGHPSQNRAISIREGAILQSFPQNYIFADNLHSATKRELGVHIGNAVPVELGRAIGMSILKHLDNINM